MAFQQTPGFSALLALLKHVKSTASVSIAVGGKELERKGESEYLGCLFKSAGSLDADLGCRCQQAAV